MRISDWSSDVCSSDLESDGWRQSLRWPATGRLSGFFGSQRVYQGKPGSYHSGTDIAVPAGTPFMAPADGVVTLAATTPFTLEGRLLIVDHRSAERRVGQSGSVRVDPGGRRIIK